MKRSVLLIPAAVIAVAAVLSSLFIVDEREKVLVLQFGQIKSVHEDPGLNFKIPLIQEVVRYDDRILGRDVEALEVTPSDDRRLVVDAFARFRIVDVVRFRQATGAGGEAFAENRIDTILRAQIREVLGSVDSSEILSENRAALAARIRDAARVEAAALGVDIVDVRLRRTDLPDQNLEATFARMRAAADRAVIETVSDARRQAEIIRGEADAKRSAIFAEAYGADPDFFEFFRSLASYRASLLAENSTFVIAPDSEFFDFFRSSNAPTDGAAPATE